MLTLPFRTMPCANIIVFLHSGLLLSQKHNSISTHETLPAGTIHSPLRPGRVVEETFLNKKKLVRSCTHVSPLQDPSDPV